MTAVNTERETVTDSDSCNYRERKIVTDSDSGEDRQEYSHGE